MAARHTIIQTVNIQLYINKKHANTYIM